jgi:hypothetical protein|tara:strand:- start:271 stop:474 length:204 start_codon:yes stop_codon:yes gene_type:complete
MKTESIQEVAKKYNCTLSRAAIELLCAAGQSERRYPAVIRKQKISDKLIFKAEKVLDFSNRGLFLRY